METSIDGKISSYDSVASYSRASLYDKHTYYKEDIINHGTEKYPRSVQTDGCLLVVVFLSVAGNT